MDVHPTRKRRLSKGETAIDCPHCGQYRLWACWAPGGVYLACANSQASACPDATGPCATLEQAVAQAEALAQRLAGQNAPGKGGQPCQFDLFGDSLPLRRTFATGGYAAKPGTGPAGKTCRQCRNYVRVQRNDQFHPKCCLLEKQWTHGKGTDIKAGAAACAYFEEEKPC